MKNQENQRDEKNRISRTALSNQSNGKTAASVEDSEIRTLIDGIGDSELGILSERLFADDSNSIEAPEKSAAKPGEAAATQRTEMTERRSGRGGDLDESVFGEDFRRAAPKKDMPAKKDIPQSRAPDMSGQPGKTGRFDRSDTPSQSIKRAAGTAPVTVGLPKPAETVEAIKTTGTHEVKGSPKEESASKSGNALKTENIQKNGVSPQPKASDTEGMSKAEGSLKTETSATAAGSLKTETSATAAGASNPSGISNQAGAAEDKNLPKAKGITNTEDINRTEGLHRNDGTAKTGRISAIENSQNGKPHSESSGKNKSADAANINSLGTNNVHIGSARAKGSETSGSCVTNTSVNTNASTNTNAADTDAVTSGVNNANAANAGTAASDTNYASANKAIANSTNINNTSLNSNDINIPGASSTDRNNNSAGGAAASTSAGKGARKAERAARRKAHRSPSGKELNLRLSPAPHIKSSSGTGTLMLNLLIAMLPLVIWGIYIFGFRVLSLLIISLICCTGFEVLSEVILNLPITVTNLSSTVTAVLITLMLPASVPFWIPVFCAFIAIIPQKLLVGKADFQWFNPALIARVVSSALFPKIMSSYPEPRSFISALSFFPEYTEAELTSLATLKLKQLPQIALSGEFFGKTAGAIGEISAFLIIIGFIYLIVTKTVTWQVPVVFAVSAAIPFYLFPQLPFSSDMLALKFAGFELVSGGFLFGAVFIAASCFSSPKTQTAKLIYGVGCGLLSVLFRIALKSYDGVYLAVLIMSLLSRPLDSVCTPVPFGKCKPKHSKS